MEIENRQNKELLQSKSFIQNFVNDPKKEDVVYLSSSSDEEQDEIRNPLFPSL